MIRSNIKIIDTHTGKIFVDKDRKLEFLTVGDYGKENNLKANFLGLTKEIRGVKHTEVDLFAKSTTGLRQLVANHIQAETIHPVVSTMLPKNNPNLTEFILRWCEIKNETYQGEAGLQFSINSTDEAQRDEQFSGMSLSLEKISELAKKLPHPVGRKYTLNFAVTKDTILDAEVLDKLFDKNDWLVKITPIHETRTATENGFDVGDTYTEYDVYRQFEQPLLDRGWDVIVFVPSREEDSDRITCGNALIADNKS